MFVNWAVGGSKASPPINLVSLCGAKTVEDPLGATFLIDIPANSPTKRFPSRSKASDRGAFKAGLYVPNVPRGDPVEENFRTVLVPKSASYKLPALSTAKPSGSVSPLETNVLTLPLVV